MKMSPIEVMRVIFWIEKVGMGFKGVVWGRRGGKLPIIYNLINIFRREEGLLGLIPKNQ